MVKFFTTFLRSNVVKFSLRIKNRLPDYACRWDLEVGPGGETSRWNLEVGPARGALPRHHSYTRTPSAGVAVKVRSSGSDALADGRVSTSRTSAMCLGVYADHVPTHSHIVPTARE